ncbi:MAG TPA: hypothetical protein VG898_09195 [Solirubrobacterales bacterium]|nr:hypothetical protein [Solirubrobacterales bacterium]
MAREEQESKRESTASSVRRRVLASRDRIWRTQDFDGSRDAVQAELRRLVRTGELERIRRSVYWRGRKTRFGPTVADEGKALRKLLGRAGVGAAGWYATNLLGLSTQVAPTEMLAITGRPPAGFSHLRLVDRSRRVGRHDARLNDLEITFLEALEGWDKYVERNPVAATDRFQELLRGGEVRISRLVQAAATEPAVVRERLRRLLVEGGWQAEAARVEGARSDSARRRALSVFPNPHASESVGP